MYEGGILDVVSRDGSHNECQFEKVEEEQELITFRITGECCSLYTLTQRPSQMLLLELEMEAAVIRGPVTGDPELKFAGKIDGGLARLRSPVPEVPDPLEKWIPVTPID
ncbi:hypothetical protein FOL47_000233 [Perkinsus chesapeaki]|uniref:Uncharacterized protein n=1 Tax=Perkinsus chesapeaki TaxID=330153 RepID=A0A7J6MN70_PERCH|nr:hypothetical protein FOL47_000233 [Perkinsus chesapeaki]